MSGNDSIVINVRERPLSSDINNLQSLAARTLMNLMRGLGGAKFLGVPGLELPVNSYPAGLIPGIAPSGVDIQIGPGILLQDSTTLAPAPTALDSTTRYGANPAPVVVLMPSPGVETFYLIEAQVTPVTVSTASRDILDPVSGNFVPTLVTKEVDYQVQFQLLTGGADAPVPTGGEWVPLCIVRRPAGGGAIVASDIIDVRKLSDFSGPRSPVPVMRRCTIRSNSLPDTPSNDHEINAEIDGPFGVRSYDDLIAFTDLGSASVLAPATAFAADTWYYAYLAGWSSFGISPSPAVSPLRQKTGVLVVSGVAPDRFRRNGAPIPLPPPYGTSPQPATTAYCIGAFRRNSANTGFLTSNIYEDAATITNISALVAALGVAAPSFTPTLNLAGFYPAAARSVRVLVEVETTAVVGAVAETDGYITTIVVSGAVTPYHTERVGFGKASFQVDLPVASLGDLYDITFLVDPVGGTAAMIVRVDVIGWNW